MRRSSVGSGREPLSSGLRMQRPLRTISQRGAAGWATWDRCSRSRPPGDKAQMPPSCGSLARTPSPQDMKARREQHDQHTSPSAAVLASFRGDARQRWTGDSPKAPAHQEQTDKPHQAYVPSGQTQGNAGLARCRHTKICPSLAAKKSRPPTRPLRHPIARCAACVLRKRVTARPCFVTLSWAVTACPCVALALSFWPRVAVDGSARPAACAHGPLTTIPRSRRLPTFRTPVLVRCANCTGASR